MTAKDESNSEPVTRSASGVGRIIAIVVVVVLFVLLIACSSTSQKPADKIWDEATTVGSLEAKNYYIMYTDLMCPYCDVFSRAAMEHWDEFTAYLDEHDILFEVRLTDALYEGNGIEYSRNAAAAAYCAKNQNKFWEFYHGAITALWNDYHSKGIGNNKSATPIKDMPEDYWLRVGKKAGLTEDFENCVKNGDSLAEVDRRTALGLQASQGMPTFVFNKFTTSGFGDTWDWDYVLRYLDAGLK